jgi:tetratricopeptide (TPR) repeat protein
MSGPCHFRNSTRSLIAAALLTLIIVTTAAADDADLCQDRKADPDAAISACTRLLRQSGDASLAAELYYHRGRAKERKGDIDSAVKDFDATLNENPKHIDALKFRGIDHKSLGLYNDAIKDFTRAVGLIGVNNKSYEFWVLRGETHIDKEDYDIAIEDFSRAISLDRTRFEGFSDRGLAYHEQRKFERAIDDFNNAVHLAPKNPFSYANRAAARMEKADFKNAIDDYNEAIRLDSENPRWYTQRGDAWRVQGDLGRSLADHNRAIEIRPSEYAYNNRALAFIDQRKYEQALADCNEAILLNGAYDQAYATRGLVHRLMGDLKGSLRDLDEALRRAPRSKVAFAFRGDTRREFGDVDSALKDFNAAIADDHEFVPAYTGRGLTYEKKGDLAKAKDDYRAALKLPPEVGAALAKPAQAVAKEHLAAIAAKEKEAQDDAAAATAAGRVNADALRQLQNNLRTQEEARKKAETEAANARKALQEAKEALGAAAAQTRGNADALRELQVATGNLKTQEQSLKKAETEVASTRKALQEAEARRTELENQLKAELAAREKIVPGAPKPTPIYSCAGSKRVALVVGNGAYPGAAALSNPPNDAEDVAALLRGKLCFEVIKAINAKFDEFTQKISDFANKADGAEVALFYYAGHGMQIQQVNYLLPVDIPLAKEGVDEYVVTHKSVSAQDIVNTLDNRAKFKLIFLDACRDNPSEDDFRKRMNVAQRGLGGGERGLAPMTGGVGETMVVFATRANTRASDGAGRNSPFTTAFLENIAAPGRDLESVLHGVQRRVRELTTNHQFPQAVTEFTTELTLLPER